MKAHTPHSQTIKGFKKIKQSECFAALLFAKECFETKNFVIFLNHCDLYKKVFSFMPFQYFDV